MCFCRFGNANAYFSDEKIGEDRSADTDCPSQKVIFETRIVLSRERRPDPEGMLDGMISSATTEILIGSLGFAIARSSDMFRFK